MRHGVLAEFLFGICIVVSSVMFLLVTWCACRVFLFLLCSFLVNFTKLERIQHNINILSRTVLLLAFIFIFNSCFCLVPGVGGVGGWGWGLH